MKCCRFIILLAIASLSITGCYMPIEGQVVDAETNQPIEGAVVLVEWTRTQKLGFTRTLSYKVAEVFSDKDGRFKLPGCYRPFVDPPDITIYKKNYVAWNNRLVFPSHKKRTDFKWGSYVFKLEPFKNEFSHVDHTAFLRFSINSTINLRAKRLIYDAFDWEDRAASIERDRQARNKQK